MAIVAASGTFTLGELNFYSLRDTTTEFFDNAYEFSWVKHMKTSSHCALTTVPAQILPAMGSLSPVTTVRLHELSKFSKVSATTKIQFVVQALSTELVDVDAAIGTSSISDDLAIWAEQFSGNDTIILDDFSTADLTSEIFMF